MIGTITMCGCHCEPPSPAPRQPRPPQALTAGQVDASPTMTAVIAAIWANHTHAWAIARHTAIPSRTVYETLARLEAAGWLSSHLQTGPWAGPQRRVFALTRDALTGLSSTAPGR